MKFNQKYLGNEIQGNKEEKGERKKKEGKKKVEIGEKTLMKFAGV